MLALALLLATSPAQALDLALSFDGPEAPGPAATVQDVGTEPRLVALEDGLGDRWVLELSVLAEDQQGATLAGTARLLDVPDPTKVRRFELSAPYGQPVAVPVADPAGEVRMLGLVATAGGRPEVVCELLTAPTVHDLADALQELVDEGREPRTGVGLFTVEEEQVVEATWVCGW